jgi:hypothetical protein
VDGEIKTDENISKRAILFVDRGMMLFVDGSG